jgi:putative endonuclease
VPQDGMAFVYLLASTPYGTLYVGSTFDLPRRIYEHKAKVVPGFTAKYCVDRLLWCENHETLEGAIWETPAFDTTNIHNRSLF